MMRRSHHSSHHHSTIEKLRQKLFYYEEDEDNMKMFKETLRMFKSKSLQKFEHEMDVTKDVRVYLHMVPVDSRADTVGSKPDPTDEVIKEYRTRVEHMEDIITKLKRETLELSKENVRLKKNCQSIEQQAAEIAKLKQENAPLTQRLVDQATDNVELERNLGIMKSTAEHLHKTNEKLQKKLSQLEEDKKMLEVFREALHLFEKKSCRKFEHEIELSENLKVQCNMILKENDDSKSMDDEDKEQSEQRHKELEDLVTELEQRLDVVELKQQGTQYNIDMD